MTKGRRLENTYPHSLVAVIKMVVHAETGFAEVNAREELEGQGYVVISISNEAHRY